MNDIQQRRNIYKKSIDNKCERDLIKFRVQTGDYFCKHEEELLNLINTIPNWETYLTDKQLQITKIYVGCRNTTNVDIHLGLTNGLAYHTLFGSIKNKTQVGGVLKKLQIVKQRLDMINKNKKFNK